MTTAAPLLEITDGTLSVNLLDPQGLMLYDWIPSLADPKGGGVWNDNPLVEGRRLAYRQLGNVTDTFELKVRGASQDSTIRNLQELRRLLEKAVEYWVSSAQNEPVYLIVRGSLETNTRYAVIFDYRTPRDANPFAQPFFSCNALVDNFLLTVEHGIWQNQIPGNATCVEISAQQEFAGSVLTETAEPNESADDAGKGGSIGVWTTLDTTLYLGSGANTGVRFYDVDIPVGATILQAWVDFVCSGEFSPPDTPVNVDIYGDDADDSAIFSTEVDYNGRTRTAAFVSWNNIPHWILGNTYSTPEVKTIIQEVIDRVGWASGNHISLLFDDPFTSGYQREAASWDNAFRAAPILYVKYTTAEGSTFGRSATCNSGEVYVANKNNRAQLTDVYYYDASGPAWSGNLIGAATPFDFLPATPANGDIVYFGINTTVSDSGPFCSLVFDITTGAVDVTTINWEYYNGAWTAFTTDMQDNTNEFANTGVHSVHWQQFGDWTTVAVNGITGYWVRARVAGVGGAPAAPQQGNRDIYTIAWSYIDIDHEQIKGDLPALARIILTNQSDEVDGDCDLRANRFVIGSRTLDRGDDFNAYLNFSDEQNPSGVTVAVAGESAFATDLTTPSGRRVTFTSDAEETKVQITVTLDSTIAPDYLGEYRAFIRYKYNTGNANETAFRLKTTPGPGNLTGASDWFWPQDNLDWQTADLGIVRIPYRTPTDSYGTITFEVECYTEDAAKVVYFYDMVLIPVDEWCSDSVDKSGQAARTGAIGNGDLLDIDSVTYPKDPAQSVMRVSSTGRIQGYYQHRAGPTFLQANSDQRLWFFNMAYETGTEVSSFISNCYTVQTYAVQRYLSMRGAR